MGFSLIQPILGEENNAVQFHLLEGKNLFNKKNYSEAIVEFENVLIMVPAHIQGRLWLGKGLAALKNYPEALNQFQEILQYEPKHPEALELIEKFQILTRTEALDDISTGPNPNSPLQKNPLGKSGKVFSTLYDQNMENFETINRRVRKFGLVMPESVVQSSLQTPLPRGGIITQFFEPSVLDRVYQLMARDKLLEAVTEYLAEVDRDKNVLALSDRGLIPLGEERLLKELAEYPNDLQILFLLGKLIYIQGRYEECKPYLLKIQKISPTSDQATKTRDILETILAREALLARIAAAKKAAEEARIQRETEQKLLSAQSKLSPKLGGVASKIEKADSAKNFTEGLELYKSGKLEKSIEKFEMALKGNPQNSQFKFQLATAYTDLALSGRKAYFNPAIGVLSDLVQKDPLGPYSKEASEMINDIKAINQ